jgi:SAM-dependent methyltransferase
MSAPSAVAQPRESYSSNLFAPLFAAEDRHFWFQARNRILAAAIAPLERQLRDGYRILEVGCGTGFVLRMLDKLCRRGEVVGLDAYAEGLRLARQRVQCRLVEGDLFRWPFEQNFQVIGLFDVLEHLEDDLGALQQLRKGLSPGGRLVLTTPAHMSLWSYADTQAHHCRRYSASALKAVMQRAGFEVEYLTEFMGLLFPLAWLVRRLVGSGAKAGSDPLRDEQQFLRELRIVPGVNGMLRWLLSREASFVKRRWRLPVGTSLLAIGVVRES